MRALRQVVGCKSQILGTDLEFRSSAIVIVCYCYHLLLLSSAIVIVCYCGMEEFMDPRATSINVQEYPIKGVSIKMC